MASTKLRVPQRFPLAGAIGFAVVVLAFALFPSFVKKPYVLHMGVMLFLAIIQGQAWNVLGGYTGQYSVGHAAYFGVGAYVTMMLLEVGKVAPWWGIWVAMAVSVLLSVVIGAITFRLRGPYFVLASISAVILNAFFNGTRFDQAAAVDAARLADSH